jgi:hypothetical protein
MSAEQKNSIFWWAKMTGIVVGVITMLGILVGGVLFTTEMYANSKIMQNNQDFISKTINEMQVNQKGATETLATVVVNVNKLTLNVDKLTDRLNDWEIEHGQLMNMHHLPPHRWQQAK